jgi:hypothetical protein
MPHPPDAPSQEPLTFLVPNAGGATMDAFLTDARSLARLPFVPERKAVLESLSRTLLAHPRLGREPAGASLAFWLRRASLASLEAGFRLQPGPGMRVPAGLVFHVAPANVDTLFIYSWALSFLCGNSNVVRLTTRLSPQMSELLACLEASFAEHPDACRGNAFVTYGHDDAVTTRISLACDTRVVWGGNETVHRLRSVPLAPHASERSFASKRSLSVIAAGPYHKANESARDQLADRISADIAPFAQMACSSPQVLYWVGADDECREAVFDLGPRLEAAMAARLGEPDLGFAVRRLTHSFDRAAAGAASFVEHRCHTTQVAATLPSEAEPEEACGAGLLNHGFLASVGELTPLLRRDHQTISYFGLTELERGDLAQGAGMAGVDRIVPIGRALDFGPYWDGFNLWDDLTRMVVVE